MATSGKLHVTIVEARVTRDTETFGTQDPYVEIEHRMERFKTKPAGDGGKEPKFDETFTFDVKYIGDDFTMRIMNKNMIMNDDLIADATIKISGLCLPGGIDEWWKVQYKGKDGGAIRFNAKWEPKDAGEADLCEKNAEIERLKEQQRQMELQNMQMQHQAQLQGMQAQQAQMAAYQAQAYAAQ